MTVNSNIRPSLIGSLLLLSVALVSAEYVPVYIWESSKSNEIVPALPRINQETFKEIIQEKLDKKSFVVIFAEPNLSSEDFSAVDTSGKNVFSHLSNIKTAKTYLPAVDNPIDVVRSIYDSEVSETTIKDFDVDNLKSPVLIIDLDDVQDDEDRSQILQRHDEIIQNIYKALQEKKGDIVAVYTGYHSSWIIPELSLQNRQSRNILQASTRAEGARQIWWAEVFLLYVSNTPFIMINNQRTNLTEHIANFTFENERVLQVNLTSAGQSSVNFNFNFAGGYWKLDNVVLVDAANNNNETTIKVRDVNAPEEFSFQCTNQIFAPRGYTGTFLSLPGMQLQVFRAPHPQRFGDPYYCVGFTTAPIWSGIFVTAILVTIMAVGLSMMMDIKTMDRFDDPKGKTIQINTSE